MASEPGLDNGAIGIHCEGECVVAIGLVEHGGSVELLAGPAYAHCLDGTFGLDENGEDKRSEHRDDSDDDEKFYESESPVFHFRLFYFMGDL